MLYKTCYVLRRRDYSETSFLLELLTSDSQYVHAIYRGAKRKGSTTIDLFSSYDMSWRPRDGLVTLRSCELNETFVLKGEALYAGLYLNELIRRGMRENQIAQGMQVAYVTAIEDLATTRFELETCLRRFEREYLRVLGFEIVFTREQSSGNAITNERRYRFNPIAGFQKVRDDAATDGVFDGSVLLDIAEHCYEEEQTRQAAKLILREALVQHVGEKAIKARSLLTARHYREAVRPSTDY